MSLLDSPSRIRVLDTGRTLFNDGTVEAVKRGRISHAPERFTRYFGSPASRPGPVALRPRIPAGLPLSIPRYVKIDLNFTDSLHVLEGSF